MKTNILSISILALALAACSESDIVNDSQQPVQEGKTAIGFSTRQGNITRASDPVNLETLNRYNFGIYGYYEKMSGTTVTEDEEFMNNYLVGYSNGEKIGYDPTTSDYWAASAGTREDHTSPWFYDGLGNSQYTYTGSQGFYTTSDADKMSANTDQIMHYWEKSYGQTSFYFYSPYCNNTGTNQVTFDYDTKKFTLSGDAAHDSYANDLNPNPTYTPASSEFYFGKKSVQPEEYNLDLVNLQMQRLGSRVLIAFYSDIKGYKVEIIDLNADNGTLKAGLTDDYKVHGIQANPVACNISDAGAVSNIQKTKASYNNNANGISVDISGSTPTVTVASGYSTTTDNLMFRIPGDATVTDVSSITPKNLTATTIGSKTYNFIPQKVTSGTQTYAYSPTIYYPVPQPEYVDGTTPGFMFHISFRIVNETTNEVTTVHNAKVYVPAWYINESKKINLTSWEANTQYTYIFRITGKTNGTTDPDTPIDPDDPTPSDDPALVPIVFDNVEVESITDVTSHEFTISDSK